MRGKKQQGNEVVAISADRIILRIAEIDNDMPFIQDSLRDAIAMWNSCGTRASFDSMVNYGAMGKKLLEERDELQKKIDKWGMDYVLNEIMLPISTTQSAMF